MIRRCSQQRAEALETLRLARTLNRIAAERLDSYVHALPWDAVVGAVPPVLAADLQEIEDLIGAQAVLLRSIPLGAL